MEFVEFRILPHRENEFELEFQNILSEENISCSQWEKDFGGGELSVMKIPDYAIEKMSDESIKLLNSFIVNPE